MINPISTGRAERVSLGGLDGGNGGPGARAAAAMTTLSNRVATTLTGQLGLVDPDARGGYSGGSANDAYGVGQVAAELSASLGGGPADTGRLSRALHEFTSEVAATIAAKPHSSVLGMVSALHFNLVDGDGRPGSTDADYAFAAIQAGIFRLREDAPW